MSDKKQAKKPKLKKKAGRPSKKDSIDIRTLTLLASFGLTDIQIAKAFGISEATLTKYKKDPEFLASLKDGKDIHDAQVERSLRERATGYEHEDVDIRVVNGKIVKTKLIKHYPPDPTSMIFWLKNRQPTKWRDRTDTKVGIGEKEVELILAALPPEIATAVRQKLLQIKEL
jgi:hypothetical protein